jgi:hypothetical protein
MIITTGDDSTDDDSRARSACVAPPDTKKEV